MSLCFHLKFLQQKVRHSGNPLKDPETVKRNISKYAAPKTIAIFLLYKIQYYLTGKISLY